MSESGDGESIPPLGVTLESPSSKRRRETRIPARFRDYDSLDSLPPSAAKSSSKGRGRPISPAKRLSAPPSNSPIPHLDEEEVAEAEEEGLVTYSVQTANAVAVPSSRPPLPQPPSHPPPSTPQANLRRQLPPHANQTKRIAQSELTSALKENLRRLKNLLKLPMARRWVYCEFFYSGVDEQLLLSDNEFSTMLSQSFPNLKCRRLCRPEWRSVRRLIGKPRRCSVAFLDEERRALDSKRCRVRQIYEGSQLANADVLHDLCDLPPKLPRPLVVGMKIFARVRAPKDGVYAGTIDAVLPSAYRVVFDKEDLIAPMVVQDFEVMSEARPELLPLQYFIDQSKALFPQSIAKLPVNAFGRYERVRSFDAQTRALAHKRLIEGPSRDEKVGNFPVRMLVILVKLAKLIEHKRSLVRQLAELNAHAEKVNMLTDSYAFAFQEKYASVVVDLEALNKQMSTYLNGIQEYHAQLLPQLSEVPVTSRPDALRKLCHTHAHQIVKHCNNGLNVRSKAALSLMTSLTSLLLQVRSLGQQRCSPLDLNTLNESLNDIRFKLSRENLLSFQDYVEVNMKQIHTMMSAVS